MGFILMILVKSVSPLYCIVLLNSLKMSSSAVGEKAWTGVPLTSKHQRFCSSTISKPMPSILIFVVINWTSPKHLGRLHPSSSGDWQVKDHEREWDEVGITHLTLLIFHNMLFCHEIQYIFLITTRGSGTRWASLS